MEKGCSLVSYNCESGEEESSQQENSSESKTKSTQDQVPSQAAEPSTSQEVNTKDAIIKGRIRTVSMSLLRGEDVVDCVSSNSQDGFAVVLDDETSSEPGVLETFEISSSNSNSMPANSFGGAEEAEVEVSTVDVDDDVVVVVPVDDSSSTDTLNGNDENGNLEEEDHSSMNNIFFADHNDHVNEIDIEEPPPIIQLDDDDFDEEIVEEEIVDEEIVEEDDEEEEDDDDVIVEQSMPPTSQSYSHSHSHSHSQLNAINSCVALDDGIIVSADGSKIFLETPVVEEPLLSHHTHVHPCVQAANANAQTELLNGKPKRLSDEFETEARGEDDEEVDQELEEQELEEHGLQQVEIEAPRAKSEPLPDVASTSIHDRQMSVRLKQMSLSGLNAEANANAAANAAANAIVANSSSNSNCNPSQADIESMDRIERRDFETEQRLTGGIILGTSSLVSKNRLNLSLINRGAAAGGAATQGTAAGTGAGACGVSSSSDDWPSSSNGRAFSSDSKCTYKDLSTTPTSSRKYTNSRLSKSTAKLNLGSSLGTTSASTSASASVSASVSASSSSSTVTCPQNTSSSSSSSSNSNNSKLPTNHAKSSVIVEPSGSNAIASTSNSKDILNTSSSSSSSSSNSTADKDKDNSTTAKAAVPFVTSYTSVGSQTNQESGCSRTGGQPYSLDVDAQPSTSSISNTSSARCHYAAPGTKNLNARSVNASAQTQERFLARNGLAAGGVNNINIGGTINGNIRARRRVDTTRNGGTSDVIVLEVVVEENNDLGEGGEFNADEPWGNCDEENNCSDLEEICTCQNSMLVNSRSGSVGSLSETLDMDATDGYGLDESASVSAVEFGGQQGQQGQQQRKRKYNEGRLLDGGDYSMNPACGPGGNGSGTGDNSRKRIAYDFSSSPRSSSAATGAGLGSAVLLTMTPTGSLGVGIGSSLSSASCSPALGRRTPRALMPTRDNPPPELQHWLSQFQRWSHAERLLAVDRLIDHCDPSQVRHMMKVIEPQFQRDFISLLPRELALFVLSYLEPKDLLRAAQTCRSWRFLCDDNLLWKEKCRKAQILTETRSDRPKRGRDGNMPPIASPWKAAYMRQHIIEMNWRSRPVRKPKVLKGHDDHVITCLQFSGNRIVSGSDDNTLKVWSAVNGKCLRTLVGHTGGVWSSQMAGNIIISGSTDRTLKVWDMDSGTCVHTLQGHTSTVRCMHLHGTKVVSGSRDATLRVWDIELGTCLHVLVGHLAAVRCVQYDGKLIVSGAYDYMVKIWHPERQECLHTLQGHTNRVYSLQFDGLHVVSGSLDTSIRVWDVETGNCKHTLMGHQSLTSGMELRQNILVSGNADSTVKVWDITTGQCLQTLSGPNKHQSAVTCLQFNSRFVVTSSDDGTVKLWDVKTGDFIRNLVALDSGGSGGVVWRIRANDTKLICAVGSRNGTEETKLMVLDFDVEGACVKCS